MNAKELSWNKPFTDGSDIISISEVTVLKSAAGYYIGTLCKHVGDECDGLIEPNERMSFNYWATYEEAEAHLRHYKED